MCVGVGSYLLSFPFDTSLLPNVGAAFPSVPAGKSPMVEQAVQTGSLDNLNTKKLLPSSKGAVGVQLNGRAAPPSSKSTSGTETRGPWGAHPLLSMHPAAWGLVKGAAPL